MELLAVPLMKASRRPYNFFSNNFLVSLLSKGFLIMKNTVMVGINITAKRGRIVRACISIRFSPITRVNIAVSYIIYIYYNKEKEALKVWENI